jgi:hypothetical protein
MGWVVLFRICDRPDPAPGRSALATAHARWVEFFTIAMRCSMDRQQLLQRLPAHLGTMGRVACQTPKHLGCTPFRVRSKFRERIKIARLPNG